MPIVGTDKINLKLINLETFAVEAFLELAEYNTALGAIPRFTYFDGLNVHAGWLRTSGDNRMAHLIPNGNTFTLVSSETPGSTAYIDVCFDGMFYWFLTGSNAIKKVGPKHSDITLTTWAHGLTSPRGIFFDGINIGITQ